MPGKNKEQLPEEKVLSEDTAKADPIKTIDEIQQEHLYIWAMNGTTDPDMTEKVNFGAFKFTTIDAHSQVLAATKTFGPFGCGWGIRHGQFTPIVADPADAHFTLLHYHAFLWYIHPKTGKECGYDIDADIELFENTKNGWKRVSDPTKKVRTDAMTKGLSLLGFNADVFLGRFDDSKYVQSLQNKKRQDFMKAEKEKGREGHELAFGDQLETIQRLAGQARLAGADFASWLRETHSTSWSRLTAAVADEVINSLNQLLQKPSQVYQSKGEQLASAPAIDSKPKEATAPGQPTQAPSEVPAPESQPEAELEQADKPAKPGAGVGYTRRTISDYTEGLTDAQRGECSQHQEEVITKIELCEDCRQQCVYLVQQASDGADGNRKMMGVIKNHVKALTSLDALPSKAHELLKLKTPQLEALKKTLLKVKV